jgi:hypothetical protein
MTTQQYRELILDGIKDLPPETLAEITDFVYFVRKRAVQPQAFEEDRYSMLLHADLRQLSRDEAAHNEAEFDDYEQRHPR